MENETIPSGIPQFRPDGYLPEGLHSASEAEVIFRFGTGSRRRHRLVARLRRWVELSWKVGAQRLLIDGSFVTTKREPQDVDAVILLPPDFEEQIEREEDAALELEGMLLDRVPEEIFAAETRENWQMWVEFFSRTREQDGRRKGLVEILL